MNRETLKAMRIPNARTVGEQKSSPWPPLL